MSGVLIDANLLCLLVVGRHGAKAIGAHPRLDTFDRESLGLLGDVLDHWGDPVLCPHVLAETANLLAFRQSPDQRRRWRSTLAELVESTREVTVKALRGIAHPAYLQLGLTDAVLLTLAADQRLTLLSVDLALCIAAERAALRNINFNHLRDGALRIDQL